MEEQGASVHINTINKNMHLKNPLPNKISALNFLLSGKGISKPIEKALNENADVPYIRYQNMEGQVTDVGKVLNGLLSITKTGL